MTIRYPFEPVSGDDDLKRKALSGCRDALLGATPAREANAAPCCATCEAGYACNCNALALAGDSAKPAIGDVWLWMGREHTITAFEPASPSIKAGWVVTTQCGYSRIAANPDGTLNYAWTFVRSAADVKDEIFSKSWATRDDLCALLDALCTREDSATSCDARDLALGVVEINVYHGTEAMVAEWHEVAQRLAPIGMTVVVTLRSQQPMSAGTFANPATAKALAMADLDAAMKEMSAAMAPLKDFGASFAGVAFPKRPARRMTAETRRVFHALEDGFRLVADAMQTERGHRLLNEQLVRDTLAHCPHDLDRRGFEACLIADFERSATFVPATGNGWKHLKPAQYAADMALMIRNQITLVGWKGPNKNPMVGVYERAMKTPARVEGKWTWRRR